MVDGGFVVVVVDCEFECLVVVVVVEDRVPPSLPVVVVVVLLLLLIELLLFTSWDEGETVAGDFDVVETVRLTDVDCCILSSAVLVSMVLLVVLPLVLA